MFGLTEEEVVLYKDLAQDYAVRDVAPTIISASKFITPLVEDKNGKPKPDALYIQQLLTDIETVITLTTTHMAYDYAYLQCESDKDEEGILKHLHNKYEDYLVSQFIKYGIAFTTAILTKIIGEIILELPFLYASVIYEDDFDGDEFLDEKLEAYEKYLEENFSDDLEEE